MAKDQLFVQGAALSADVDIGPGETLDALYRGELVLIQRRDGYRFSIDPILLAAFAGKPQGRGVDLGTGCGIMPLLLAKRGACSVVGIELQAPMFQMAWRNVQLNGCGDRVHIINADLRNLRGILAADSFDFVVSNPPYIARGAGNVNPMIEKAVARHELTCSLPDVARSAKYLLRDGGSFRVIFPASRLVELFEVLPANGLQPRRMRLVHPLANRPAKMVLVEAVKNGGEVLEAQPALVLHDAHGGYTAEVQRLLSDASACLDLLGEVGQS